jgi:hypothetical protein
MTMPLKRTFVIAILLLGFASAGAIALGSKLISLVLFTLSVVIGIIGCALRREPLKWCAFALAVLFLGSVLAPIDIAFEWTNHFTIELLENPREQVVQMGDKSVRLRSHDLQIGTRTQWFIVIGLPHT